MATDKPIWIVNLTHADGGIALQFTCPAEEGRASYLAGVALDTLADATGDTFGYTVKSGPSVVTAEGVRELAHAALKASADPIGNMLPTVRPFLGLDDAVYLADLIRADITLQHEAGDMSAAALAAYVNEKNVILYALGQPMTETPKA